MKDVKIKVYEFDELPELLQTKIKSSTADELVDMRFEAFSESIIQSLKDKYGVDGEFGYSLCYCQGDGLHFNTNQLLTGKVAEIIKKEIPSESYSILDYLVKEGIAVPTKSKVLHYEYASRRDVDFDDSDELVEQISEALSITMNVAQSALNGIRIALTDLYMIICAEYEELGYAQYEMTEEDVIEECRNYYYYADGRIFGPKEEDEE